MRRNIFDLMNNKQINVEREYQRIHKLFEKDEFSDDGSTIYECIDEFFFAGWEKRGRYISLRDMFTSLNIEDNKGLKENTIDNLLLYIEAIVNIILILDIEYLNREQNVNYNIYQLLYENINSLLEDLNYKISELSNGNLIIVEKDLISSAVAETNKNISDKVIEYRRFILKGKTKEKRDILNLLANEVEGMTQKFKGTSYWNMMEDVKFMLNSLNIRHNNLEGKKRNQYIIDLSNEELENLYDQTFDMILGIFVIEKYIKNKNKIKELKQNIK